MIVYMIIILMLLHVPTETETTTTESVVVVDSVKANDCYEIVVVDSNGNEWAYYDDYPKANGHIIQATFEGDCIVNVQY